MGREADVDRQHPELRQHLQDAPLGRDRQGEDDEIELGAAGVLDEILDAAHLRVAGDDVGRAGLVAVVEEADDADAALGLGIERLDHGFGRSAAADDGGAAVEPARARHRRYEKGKREPLENQGPGAEEVKAREPDAGEVAADLGEEHHRQGDEDDERPGGDDPQAEQKEGPERRHRIGAGGLEHEHRQCGKPDDGRRVGQVERHYLGQVDVVNEHAETGDDHEFRQPDRAFEHHRRVARADVDVGDTLSRRRTKLAARRACRPAIRDGGRGRLDEIANIEAAHTLEPILQARRSDPPVAPQPALAAV